MQLFSNIRHGGNHQSKPKPPTQLQFSSSNLIADQYHRRCGTKQSYSDSEFSNSGSTSSYTSSDSYNPIDLKHNVSPNHNKKIPVALRPNINMISNTNSPNNQGYSDSKNYSYQNPSEVNTPNHQSTRESSVSPIKLQSPTLNEPYVPLTNDNTPIKSVNKNLTDELPINGSDTSIKPQQTEYSQPIENGHSSEAKSLSQIASPKESTPSPTNKKSSKQNTPIASSKTNQYYKQNPGSRQSINSDAYNQQLYFGYQKPPPQLAHNYNHQQSNNQPLNNDQEQDADTESDDEKTTSSGSYQPTQHPYYEQWKMYYQALAFQQQQQQQQMRQSMYYPNQNNMQQQQQNPMMPYGYQQMMQMPYMYNNMNPYMMQQQQQQQQQFQQMQQQYQQQQQQPQHKSKSRLSSNVNSHAQSLQNVSNQSTNEAQLTAPEVPAKSRLPTSNSEPNLPQQTQDQSQIYLNAYQKSRKFKNDQSTDTNELIQNSRRSTVKSNRYASEPQHFVPKPTAHHQRVASLEVNFKPKVFNSYKDNEDYDEEEEEEEEVEKGETPEISEIKSRVASVAHSLSNLGLEDKNNMKRQISDYNKFLFDDDESDKEDENEEVTNNASEEAVEEKQNEDDFDKTIVIEKTASPSPQIDQLPSPIDSLNRKDTTSSEGSYNSIQSEDRFQVASIRRTSKQSTLNESRTSRPNQQPKQKQRSPTISPPPSLPPHNYPMPPMPDMNMMQTNPVLQMQMQMQMNQMNQMNSMGMNPMGINPFGMNMGMNPMLYQNTEYMGDFNNNNSKRQSMMAPDSKRMSMMQDYQNKRNSMPTFNQQQMMSQQPQSQINHKTLDPIILKKIEEFKNLRAEISQGNKSMEYRLLWAKMLINSTNFKLYNYINIKGEYLHTTQSSSSNKAIFIKSSVTHISKIIKEIETTNQDLKTSLKCKAYFIMACLLKNDFVDAYGQDFGIPKNINQSIKFFNKVLELNSKDSRVLYKLGEIYEYEVPNSTDLAIEYYSNSSQFGYGKATDKLAKFGISIESI